MSRTIGDRYVLDREIGRGGMGVVWLATDTVLGRAVALKRLGNLPGVEAAGAAARAEREARAAARLDHPHVVGVYDLVDDGAAWWLVMEYVEGVTLQRYVAEHGPLSPDAAAALLGQAADAMAAAHGAGIVHRDIKPSNLLVTGDGVVKLTDFGIARLSADTTMTMTGMVTGSPAYLAPEIARGDAASAASDVWAFGATLLQALEGRAPYDASAGAMAVLYAIVHDEPPRTDRAGWLTPLIEGTLQKDPARRWTSRQVASFLHSPTSDASTALIAVRRGTQHGTTAKIAALGLAAAAIIVALVAGLMHATSPDPGPSAGSGAQSISATGTSDGALAAFPADYLAAVTSDPKTAWTRLTPRFRRDSGGFASYEEFWSTIAKADVSSVSTDAKAGTVTYAVTYTRDDGRTFRDLVTLHLVSQGGRLLIARET